MTFAVLTGRALAAIMLVGVLSTLTGCSSESGAQAVPDSAKADKLTQCVRPKDFMRRNHMELIKHQRDLTVRQGIRATSDSLAACIACHVKHDAAGKPIPVNAEGQFCNRCHEYLAVQPDCFGCHSTVPEGSQPANLEQQWPEVFASSPAEPAEPVAQTAVTEPTAPAEPVAQPAVTEPVVVEPPPAPAEPTAQPAVAEPVVAEPPAPAEPVVEPVAQPAPVEQSAPDGAH